MRKVETKYFHHSFHSEKYNLFELKTIFLVVAFKKKKTLQCFSCSYIIKPSKEKKINKWWVAVRFVLIEQYYCGKVIQKQKIIFHVCKIILAIICLNQKIVYGKAIQFFKQTLCCISQNNLFIFSSKLYGRYCTLDIPTLNCDKQINL